jgi:hypothetical protein
LFNYNIFKINKNKLLLINKYKLNNILRTFKDDKKEVLIKKEKLQIIINKIDKCIKEYYNKLLQKHLKIIKIFSFYISIVGFLK